MSTSPSLRAPPTAVNLKQSVLFSKKARPDQKQETLRNHLDFTLAPTFESTITKQRELVTQGLSAFEGYKRHKRQVQVYLIATKWWVQWCEYVKHKDEATTRVRTHGKNSTDDEDDLPLDPSQGSEQARIPGPISNK